MSKKNTAAHTPGPWLSFDSTTRAFAIRGPGRTGLLAEVHGPLSLDHYAPVITEEEQGANARLIAAAPDLLTACKAALVAYDSAPREWVMTAKEEEAAELLRAAIAKAEGK